MRVVGWLVGTVVCVGRGEAEGGRSCWLLALAGGVLSGGLGCWRGRGIEVWVGVGIFFFWFFSLLEAAG